MRLATLLLSLSAFFAYCWLSLSPVQAQPTENCCVGMCNTTQECIFRDYFTDSEWFNFCSAGHRIEISCEAGDGGAWDPDNPYDPWTPGGGYDGTVCRNVCTTCDPPDDPACDGHSGWVDEKKLIYCGDCSTPTDPGPGGDPPPPGGDPPPPGTTTTPPPGVTITPTPTPVPIIQGRIQSDAGAALSGNYCAQATQVPLTVPGLSLQATGSTGTHQASFGFVNPDFYTINTVSAGSGYTVTLDLSGQPTNNFWRRFIEQLYLDGITGGCGTNPLRFCPDNTLNRADLSVWLMRAKYGSDYNFTAAATPIFSDVGVDHPRRAFIEQMYLDGITGGCGTNPLRFCPDTIVTRGVASVFILRAVGTAYPLSTDSPATFTDVPDGHIFRQFIETMYRHDIADACDLSPLSFCPDNQLTRGDAAAMVMRAKYGSDYNFTAAATPLFSDVGENYICSCPAPVDPDNPYLCQYTGVTAPTANVNFYLRAETTASDSWFQVFGGNLFGRSAIITQIPFVTCAGDAACVAALIANRAGSSNNQSNGFPISASGNANNLRSSGQESTYHSYFHPSTRPTNLNAYALDTDLHHYDYDYFREMASSHINPISLNPDAPLQLSDLTGASWWQNEAVNYVNVTGQLDIDETQGFALSSNQKLVVFVDGNLNISDSNPADSQRKIISVASGGFLAFIVSGNINIEPSVGYEINPLSPSVPLVSQAGSNLEGVFVADGLIVIQSKTAVGDSLPDRKFIGAGNFVGWGGIQLNRRFDDGALGHLLNRNQATENFIHRPDLLVNWPGELKSSLSNWREVDPQLIGQ